MKILVLGGADSPEREVSLRSAKAVADAARAAGFEVEEKDPADGLDFLNSVPKGTLVFPILHGVTGEDGSIQAELEERNLPFLGSGSKVSQKCFDKWQTRQELLSAGIPIPEGTKVNRDTYKENTLAQKPHVLKIIHGGSSIGTLVVRDQSKIDRQKIDELFNMENDAVLEVLVEGIEITIPVLDKSALPPIEIRPPEGGEFDYKNKYNSTSQELCPPPSLSQKQIKQSQKLAESVHAVMNCRHLSRTDMILKTDGSFAVLEINTIPGLTDQSLYPKSAKVAGLTMPELVKRFVDLVKRDFKVE